MSINPVPAAKTAPVVSLTPKQSLISKINEQLKVNLRGKKGRARMKYISENPMIDLNDADKFTQAELRNRLIFLKDTAE